MFEVDVIDDPADAIVALDPIRASLLASLRQPDSASGLATQLGLTRQKVNYHLKALEAHGLIREVDQRLWGGLTERIFLASAASYVVSPAALGAAANDPSKSVDRLSARYLIALAARVVREVAALARSAEKQDKRLATLSVDTEVRFSSPAQANAFASELSIAVTGVVTRYHDASTPGGRAYRLVAVSHPIPNDRPEEGNHDQPR